MSIASQISRIITAKAALKSAINAKGGNLSDTQLLDDYASAVENIPGETDLSAVTVTASDILEGKKAVNSSGELITGTIATVNAVLEGNTVYVPAGFIAESQTFTVENSGSDTADATVTAETLLAGVTAYGANGKVTGTIATVAPTLTDNTVTIPAGFIAEAEALTIPEAAAAQVTGNTVSLYKGYYPQDSVLTVGAIHAGGTVTPGTTACEIPADTYLSGVLTIAGDSNLISGNIRSGVTVFGVSGTFSGSTVIGNIEFYKCASVDTAAMTWSGYKAVLTDGFYSFEETVTTGLSYGTAFTPVVGAIYNQDATVAVKSLYLDPGDFFVPNDTDTIVLFYPPAAGNSVANLATGASRLNAEPVIGDISIENGKMVFGVDSPLITFPADSLPEGVFSTGEFTLDIWYSTDFDNYTGSGGMMGLFGNALYSSSRYDYLTQSDNKIWIGGREDIVTSGEPSPPRRFTFEVWNNSGTLTWTTYLNGVKNTQGTYTDSTVRNKELYLGWVESTRFLQGTMAFFSIRAVADHKGQSFEVTENPYA